jgi:hypothetical protein
LEHNHHPRKATTLPARAGRRSFDLPLDLAADLDTTEPKETGRE